MSDQQIGMLSSDNGPGIVNGLNVLVAVAQHPGAKAALIDVIYQTEQSTGISKNDLVRDLTVASKHIVEINRMIQNCGVEPVEREL